MSAITDSATSAIAKTDPEVFQALIAEETRQQNTIELIAS